MRLQPGNVLVKLIKPESVTKAGIIIPDMAQRESTEAIILDVAENITAVKPGDKVIVEPFAGYELKIDDEQCLILDFRYVLATIG